jgi:dCTP deaminase
LSILTERGLKRKIQDRDLIISPILDFEGQVEGGSIDIRLGTKFITTRRTEYALLDPSKLSLAEAREFQAKIHRVFGHRFILHPRQLVLAGTFEFISLPCNLCAFVLSRSKYGRTGLMVATAAYVHPLWKGCLTLELYNYGDAPIKLECGAPIAQLVIQEATAVEEPYKKKFTPIPTGPEFPIMDKEPDWGMLAPFRKFWDEM